MNIRSFIPKFILRDVASAPLTPEEISEHLRTENREIVQELYSLVLNLYGSENDRTKSLDTKAATLFGFVGAVISAIFVVLGFLSDPKNTVLSSVLAGGPLYTLIAVLSLLFLSLVTLFRAVVVKKGWKAPGERDLFEAVHQYDSHVDGDSKNADKSAHDYKRHLTEHFWKLYRVSLRQNESKAIALFWGQLFVFIGLVLLVAVQVNAVLAFRGSINMSTPKNSGPTQSTPAPIPDTPQAPATPPGRPAPLPVSSQGTQIREGERPAPLNTSSRGESVRNGAGGRPTARSPSSSGTPVTGGTNSSEKK